MEIGNLRQEETSRPAAGVLPHKTGHRELAGLHGLRIAKQGGWLGEIILATFRRLPRLPAESTTKLALTAAGS
jgi:hypothetical protein